jgi:RimJ/RimL family protein N-acetyltransferase
MPPGLLPLFAYRDFGRVLDEDVIAMLASPNVVVLLAELESEPCGYITGHIENDPRRLHSRKGIVGDWYVETARRGSGIGRALLRALEKIFAEAGCEVVESATWPFNEATRRLHERLGFAEVQVVYRRRLDEG